MQIWSGWIIPTSCHHVSEYHSASNCLPEHAIICNYHTQKMIRMYWLTCRKMATIWSGHGLVNIAIPWNIWVQIDTQLTTLTTDEGDKRPTNNHRSTGEKPPGYTGQVESLSLTSRVGRLGIYHIKIIQNISKGSMYDLLYTYMKGWFLGYM